HQLLAVAAYFHHHLHPSGYSIGSVGCQVQVANGGDQIVWSPQSPAGLAVHFTDDQAGTDQSITAYVHGCGACMVRTTCDDDAMAANAHDIADHADRQIAR